jgi:hypothetical protein
MNASYQDVVKVRGHHQAQDLMESKFLLLELGCSEPTLQLCFKIIESTCLSQGVCCMLNGSQCTERFQRHIDMHYTPFLKEALRAMLMYGFVPWRVRRLTSGDIIPEVLPGGTFDWFTEVGPDEEERRRRASGTSWTQQGRHGDHHHRHGKAPLFRGNDDNTRLVVYRVTPTAGNLKQEDVNVYIYANPGLNVTANSVMSATVPSPLAHVLTDYKNLRAAQLRRSYADSWNTTAHIISTFKPNMVNQDDPTMSLMDFSHESTYEVPNLPYNPFPKLAARNWFERDAQLRRHMDRPSTHRPMVYTLPRDHDLAQQVMLNPCEDLPFLLEKFRRDISSATGVPYEMVAGRHGGQETATKTMTSGRLFSANMHEFCRHCQNLLTQVYAAIYAVNPENVEFIMSPMPRMEVESVNDLKVLFEIGALTPDMSVELSRVLLGNTARPRPSAGEKRRREEGNGNGGNGGNGGDLVLPAGKSADKEKGKWDKKDEKSYKDEPKAKEGKRGSINKAARFQIHTLCTALLFPHHTVFQWHPSDSVPPRSILYPCLRAEPLQTDRDCTLL